MAKVMKLNDKVNKKFRFRKKTNNDLFFAI